MARTVYDMMLQLKAELDGGFQGTFGKAQQQIVSMEREIQSLNKTQADITAYQKQQSAVDATNQKLETLRQQYDNIQKEIQETGTYSSDLENKLLNKQMQIDKTSKSLQNQTEKLEKMSDGLREAGVNTDNLTGESARLEKEIDELKDRQVEAADAAESFGETASSAFSTVANAIAAAGVAAALREVAEAYNECVTIAAGFEETMSAVEALSGASADELGELSALAKDLGATTKFTATEAAEAMTYMAMAGWDANEMLAGMDGVLNLAAASGEDLASVSDIVTDNLTAFGLTAADTAHFSDVLAAAATNSNTSVSIMGETFKNSASIAGALGYSIDDVAVAVGLMANAGVKGSRAGTALRNTFNGLLSGVTLTSSAFGEYEFSALKADGTMKDFASTIDELRGCFSQMTQAERVSNAMAIAGERTYNGLLAILNATDEEYASLSESIANCSGAASTMAAIKLDNANGELTLMKSAWDALKTTIGEEFLPVMQKLYQIGASVFSGINSFLTASPGLVKGITAAVTAIGLVTAGLTAYSAVTKIAAAASALLATAIPGVNVILGVAAAVAGLTGTVVAMTSAFGDATPSVKELTTAAREMEDELEDAQRAYDDTVSSTLAASSVADGYIDKLEELESAGLDTEESQREYHNVLALLCQVVPDLADSIDLETDSINGGTAALRANTEAWKQNALQQAYQDQMTAIYASYSDVLIEAEENSIQLTKAQMDLDAASTKLKNTQSRMAELWQEATEEAERQRLEYGVNADTTAYLTDEYLELENSIGGILEEQNTAAVAVKQYTKATEEDAAAVAEAREQIDLAAEAVQNLTSAETDAANKASTVSSQTEEVLNAIAGAKEQVEALADAYNDAYDAAYKSVTGQYQLWDMAADECATSADTISAALESQITYWQDYNANLQALTERSAGIEGLSDLIASFADGSADSVNAVAGLAKASDEDLAAIVESWKTLQAEQDSVSDSLAEMVTGFTEAMDDLQVELKADIEAMNLGKEAADSGKATLQGYIDAAQDMLPQVQEAYANVAKAATNALYSGIYSRYNASGASSHVDSTYAEGTTNARRGWAVVGEEGPEILWMNGGEAVVPARNIDAETTTVSGGASPLSGPVQITFQIGGDVTSEAVNRLESYADDFVEKVRSAMQSISADRARGAYA